MQNGGLWYSKSSEAVVNACVNKTRSAADYETFRSVLPGALCDITFGGAVQNTVEGVVDWAGTLFDQVSEAGKIVMLVIGVMLLLVLLAGIIFLLKIFVFTPVKFLANTATKIASGGDSENRKKKRK